MDTGTELRSLSAQLLPLLSKDDLPDFPEDMERLWIASVVDAPGVSYIWHPDASPRGWVTVICKSDGRMQNCSSCGKRSLLNPYSKCMDCSTDDYFPALNRKAIERPMDET